MQAFLCVCSTLALYEAMLCSGLMRNLVALCKTVVVSRLEWHLTLKYLLFAGMDKLSLFTKLTGKNTINILFATF